MHQILVEEPRIEYVPRPPRGVRYLVGEQPAVDGHGRHLGPAQTTGILIVEPGHRLGLRRPRRQVRLRGCSRAADPNVRILASPGRLRVGAPGKPRVVRHAVRLSHVPSSKRLRGGRTYPSWWCEATATDSIGSRHRSRQAGRHARHLRPVVGDKLGHHRSIQHQICGSSLCASRFTVRVTRMYCSTWAARWRGHGNTVGHV